MIELGKMYRDVITGFEGVATAEGRYISGCDQVLLQPKVKESGDFVESHWFDVQRLVPLDSDVIKLDNALTPGFDKPFPRR